MGLLRRLWNAWIADRDPAEARVAVAGPPHPAPGLIEVWRVEDYYGDPAVCLVAYAASGRLAERAARRSGPGSYHICTEGGDLLGIIRVVPAPAEMPSAG